MDQTFSKTMRFMSEFYNVTFKMTQTNLDENKIMRKTEDGEIDLVRIHLGFSVIPRKERLCRLERIITVKLYEANRINSKARQRLLFS